MKKYKYYDLNILNKNEALEFIKKVFMKDYINDKNCSEVINYENALIYNSKEAYDEDAINDYFRHIFGIYKEYCLDIKENKFILYKDDFLTPSDKQYYELTKIIYNNLTFVFKWGEAQIELIIENKHEGN